MKKYNFKQFAVLIAACIVLLSCSASMKMSVDYSTEAQSVDFGDGVEVEVSYRPIEPSLFKDIELSGFTPVDQELFLNDTADYILGVGDEVLIIVWGYPELVQPFAKMDNIGQVISADGTLFFPYAGRIEAAGRTTEEVRLDLTEKLSHVYQTPQVDVKITSYKSKSVFIGGSVVKQGIHYINNHGLTLPSAISLAGGFLPEADMLDVWLTRGGETWRIDYTQMYKSGYPLDKLVLKDSDKIFVPTREERKVYLIGEVVRPSVLGMDSNGKLSLAEALIEVGGFDKVRADAGAVYVMRAVGEERIEVFHLDAKNPLSLILGDRFELLPRDIIYVDSGANARFTEFIRTVLPVVQLLYYSTGTAINVQRLMDWYE